MGFPSTLLGYGAGIGAGFGLLFAFPFAEMLPIAAALSLPGMFVFREGHKGVHYLQYRLRDAVKRSTGRRAAKKALLKYLPMLVNDGSNHLFKELETHKLLMKCSDSK